MLVGMVRRRWQQESSRLVRPLLSRPKTRAMFCGVEGSFAGRLGKGTGEAKRFLGRAVAPMTKWD